MSELEAVLAQLSIFEHLRLDEIGRIAKQFALIELDGGARHAATEGLVLVVAGDVDVHAGELHARMGPGDRFGTGALVAGELRPFDVAARVRSTIAILDRGSLEHVLGAFPAVALPIARELAGDLAARDDFLRQLLELHAAKLPKAELAAAIAERRAARQRRGAHVARTSTRGLFRRLVVEQGAEPPFWMLVGFLTSLLGARLVVHLILKYKLEKQLFALVPGSDFNPMHIHHFNYGLILIGASGLAALVPFGRRALRRLALVFGLGAGLVFDEFALFWNHDPEYAQELSVIAAALAVGVLLQLVFFRRFWAALARRAWLGLRG